MLCLLPPPQGHSASASAPAPALALALALALTLAPTPTLARTLARTPTLARTLARTPTRRVAAPQHAAAPPWALALRGSGEWRGARAHGSHEARAGNSRSLVGGPRAGGSYMPSRACAPWSWWRVSRVVSCSCARLNLRKFTARTQHTFKYQKLTLFLRLGSVDKCEAALLQVRSSVITSAKL